MGGGQDRPFSSSQTQLTAPHAPSPGFCAFSIGSLGLKFRLQLVRICGRPDDDKVSIVCPQVQLQKYVEQRNAAAVRHSRTGP